MQVAFSWRASDELRAPTALVTGASSGIGLEFARQLAANGHDLVVVARDEARLKELANEVTTATEVLPADLTDGDDVAAVEARLSDASRPVDVLVNNAGFGTMGPFAQLPIEDEEREIRLNVIALVRLTRAALPGMLDRKRGGILNVSSIGAFQPGPFNATYSATKAFVSSFTEAVHEEVRGTGVHVIALCPGLTKTGFQEASGATASTMPGFLWQTSEQVVKTALRDLGRNHAVSVPGRAEQGRRVPRASGPPRRRSSHVGRRRPPPPRLPTSPAAARPRATRATPSSSSLRGHRRLQGLPLRRRRRPRVRASTTRPCCSRPAADAGADQLTGVYVLDMSDPAHPVHTDNLLTPAMQSPHESLSLNAKRGLLAADMGNPPFNPGFVDIYDVSQDCRHPVLKSSLPTRRPRPRGRLLARRQHLLGQLRRRRHPHRHRRHQPDAADALWTGDQPGGRTAQRQRRRQPPLRRRRQRRNGRASRSST